MTDKAYRWTISVLALWLLLWVVLSWAGVQDDAFIHLRYADNLFHTHLITYDGVHPSYGASSLLYVYVLAFFRAFFTSPNLPRVVSTCAHLFLVTGLAILFLKSIPRDSLARLLGLILLLIFVGPSAVRWLDDGMETGLSLCFVGLLCWATFRQSNRSTSTLPQYLACVALGFFTVLLRTELILLCGLAFVILVWKPLFNSQGQSKPNRVLSALLSGSHLLFGGILAIIFIRLRMHVFLPDTAIAKSSGVADWGGTLYVSAKIMAGALSFGVGILLLWLLTVVLLWRERRLSLTTLFANLAFPILFSLAAARGQQIQGARYFVWALFFSILWNILELSTPQPDQRFQNQSKTLAYCFLALLLLALPFESIKLYRMLRDRATLLTQFETDHLEALQGKRGVAFDIGYVGYFSRADICDLAGLVNGRDKARLTSQERFAACATTHPDFFFLDQDGIEHASHYLPIDDWQVCSKYDFRNVNQNDPHYLVLPRSTAPELCRRVANSAPTEIAPLLR